MTTENENANSPVDAVRAATRDEIAKIFLTDDRPVVYVKCPEWKLDIKLIAMRGDQAEKFVESRKDSKESGMYAIIGACAVDEAGNYVFPDPNVLRGRSLSVLNRLQNAALRLNGFKEDAPEQAKNG